MKSHDYAGEGLYFVTLCAHREFIQAAEQRNCFILEQAEKLWLPHVTHGGMIDRLLRKMGEPVQRNRFRTPGLANFQKKG